MEIIDLLLLVILATTFTGVLFKIQADKYQDEIKKEFFDKGFEAAKLTLSISNDQDPSNIPEEHKKRCYENHLNRKKIERSGAIFFEEGGKTVKDYDVKFKTDEARWLTTLILTTASGDDSPWSEAAQGKEAIKITDYDMNTVIEVDGQTVQLPGYKVVDLMFAIQAWSKIEESNKGARFFSKRTLKLRKAKP